MGECEFAAWLSKRLEAMEVDAEVYGSYLTGILGEDDDPDEEKEEAMKAVLSAVAEEDSLDSICREILRKWTEMEQLSKEKRRVLNGSRDEVQVLASMIERQAQLVVPSREVTSEERRRKEALLAQYATVEEAEDDESEETEGATATKPVAGATDKSKSLFRNTNAETVAEKQRVQREQAREDSQRKKEQDKMQREKDKVQKQEKKDEKRKKAQKVERRR